MWRRPRCCTPFKATQTLSRALTFAQRQASSFQGLKTKMFGEVEPLDARWDPNVKDGKASPMLGAASVHASLAAAMDSVHPLGEPSLPPRRVWNLTTGEPVREMDQKHTQGVTCVSLSANGAILASTSSDKTLL